MSWLKSTLWTFFVKKTSGSTEVVSSIVQEDTGVSAREQKNSGGASDDEGRKRREEARAEQDTIRRELQALCLDEHKQRCTEIAELLARFPRDYGRTPLRNARTLLRQAQRLCEEGRASGVISPSPTVRKSTDTKREEKTGKPDDTAVATSSRIRSMRWLWELLADIQPCIEAEGGDPFVVICIIMWGFMRPTKVPFIGGNYAPLEAVYKEMRRKSGAIAEAFGKRISPEQVDKAIELLKKGKIIVNAEASHGKTLYALNNKENCVDSPWYEVMIILNRAKGQLVSFRLGEADYERHA